jgi:hypothetical protein
VPGKPCIKHKQKGRRERHRDRRVREGLKLEHDKKKQAREHEVDTKSTALLEAANDDGLEDTSAAVNTSSDTVFKPENTPAADITSSDTAFKPEDTPAADTTSSDPLFKPTPAADTTSSDTAHISGLATSPLPTGSQLVEPANPPAANPISQTAAGAGIPGDSDESSSDSDFDVPDSEDSDSDSEPDYEESDFDDDLNDDDVQDAELSDKNEGNPTSDTDVLAPEGTSDDPIDVEALPDVTPNVLQPHIRRAEDRLTDSLIDLLGHVGKNNALGIFAESFVEIDERYYMEAASRQTVVSGTRLLGDAIPHGLGLQECLALQPSSKVMPIKSSWLNDHVIWNSVRLATSQGGFRPIANAEFMDPSVTGMFLHAYIHEIHGTLERWLTLTTAHLLGVIMSNAVQLGKLPRTTTRVVSAMSFPGHWAAFSIDAIASTITFVDSLPDLDRHKHASKVLPLFAQILQEYCGWTVLN